MPRRKLECHPGCYYHLYNRGHNRQNIFFARHNYLYFLRQLHYHLVWQGKFFEAIGCYSHPIRENEA
ncbi:MAG: hypothetical protein ACAF41_21150 [Leptolyngbya sp. BL-A-14]